MDCSTPGFPVTREPTPGAWSNPCPSSRRCLQPSHPLLSPSPALNLQHQSLSNESVLPIRWPKYWSFSISPSNEHSGLISFRMDWLDLLVVQGTLKSLLQHHSSKASILWCLAFFMVQFSHPYMTTGKTIALTRWTFVGKVMSLLLNMLSRLVITFLPRSKHLLICMAAITICSDFGPPGNSPNSLIFAVLILQFFIQNLRETLNGFQKYTGFKSMAMENWKEYDKCQKKIRKRASLVVQWLRICLVMQGTPVWSLVQEDLTCLRATKCVSHSYWACAPESGSCNNSAHEPKLLKPVYLEPMLHN